MKQKTLSNIIKHITAKNNISINITRSSLFNNKRKIDRIILERLFLTNLLQPVSVSGGGVRSLQWLATLMTSLGVIIYHY